MIETPERKQARAAVEAAEEPGVEAAAGAPGEAEAAVGAAAAVVGGADRAAIQRVVVPGEEAAEPPSLTPFTSPRTKS